MRKRHKNPNATPISYDKNVSINELKYRLE
jgi:hypothetical protein